jgi:D-alanyl-D-alanine carboxypeptidase (penicillin-binding protein 5/6)
MVAPFHLESLEQAEAAAAASSAPVIAVAPVSSSCSSSAAAGAGAGSSSSSYADPVPTTPHRSARVRRGRGRGRGRRWVVVALVVTLVLVLAVVGAFAAVRLHEPNPVATVSTDMPTAFKVPAAPVALPWPTTGQSAIAVPSIGVNVTSGPETPVPIASLTKMMTAYIILHDHPLAPSQNGPTVVMTATDVADFENDTVEDEANAQVNLGEALTERQLLEGLLVHSANNLADTLARWDAGSIAAFVAKMNRTAVALGMDHTHYDDPSGFDQGSQSTAGDLLKVAAPDMENPTFAGIVRMSSVTLPVAGTISSYTPLLGFEGVIGVKSGFTTAAGGCDVLAITRVVHGEPVLVLAAVTGQTGLNVLGIAGFIALNLADHASATIDATPVIRAGEVVAHVSVAGHRAAAAANVNADLLTWPGVQAKRILVDGKPISAGSKKGTRIGSMVVVLGRQRVVIPVSLRAALPKPTMLQRLF